METSINERLNSLIEIEKIKPPDIYSKIGVSRQIWGGWINQHKAIPLDKIVKILKLLPDIDARWLLTGEAAAPVKAKPYKNETELDVVNEGTGCCRRCKDLEKQIALQEELLDHYRGKKETSAESSAQVVQFAKDVKR